MKKEKIGHQCHGACNRKAEHSQAKPQAEYPSTGSNICRYCGGRYDEGEHCPCGRSSSDDDCGCGKGLDCCSRKKPT